MPLEHLKSKKNEIAQLQSRLTQMKGKKSDDEVYWKLTVDAAGQGVAEIRLLPAAEGEDFPFVEVKDYGIGVFHPEIGKKKWYIERSLETIGKKDPVKDEFWALHNLGTEEAKADAKLIRDRTSYIVWIYVVNDKNAPENNGKVMKAKLSPSIWKFVTDKLTPQFEDDEDEQPLNVFDLWEGANLKIRAYNGSNNMRTYDKTVWMNPGPLFQDDAKLEKIYDQVKGLNDEVSPTSKHYSKTYEELETKLEATLGRKLVKNQGATDHKAALNEAFAEPTSTQVAAGKDKDVGDSYTEALNKVQEPADINDAELEALLNS